VIAGVVLAAGGATRFGGPKQLADLDGQPVLEHAIRSIEAVPAIARVVVVLGARADEIRAGADLGGAELVVCPDWAEGMGASLRAGLRALDGADEVVVVLADQPFITPAVVARVRAADGDAARAVYGGAPGHPVVLRRPVLARTAELRGDQGFRGVPMTQVECGDLADPRDIDTRADLEVVRR
jgi:CTP:molybdopterin cytidylyltransferase MocA